MRIRKTVTTLALAVAGMAMLGAGTAFAEAPYTIPEWGTFDDKGECLDVANGKRVGEYPDDAPRGSFTVTCVEEDGKWVAALEKS